MPLPTPSLAAVLTIGFALAPAMAQELAYPPGVTKEIHESIQRGLEWLKNNQANEGSWRNAGGYGSYPAAMTGLAGMAFVASGSTPTRGKYWQQVRDATVFLLRHADPGSGVISVPARKGAACTGTASRRCSSPPSTAWKRTRRSSRS